MNIIFFGSDDFALVNLERLARSSFSVAACVTQPDKPKGRGMKVASSPIKEFALKNKIPLLLPADLREISFINALKEIQADLFVVIAYGKILPAEILNIPKIFCINVHGSLLPKYRGAAPINWAIIHGDRTTGVTVIKMNEMMDAGEIVSQQTIPIEEQDTAVTLRAKMAQTSTELLLKTIQSIAEKKFQLTKQDLTSVSHAPRLSKELGVIKWKDKADTIHNLVRGLLPWPAAYTYFNGKRLKILETHLTVLPSGKFAPGEILEIKKEGFLVAAADKALLIKQVHLEDSKPMDAHSFAIGYRPSPGPALG